jgi:hypothetical protein
MTLTIAQQELVRALLDDSMAHTAVTLEQRMAIRDICAQQDPEISREHVLIAFKNALVDAANAKQIPYDAQRTAMLARLVSIFILELYGAASDGESNIAPQHTSVVNRYSA